MLDCRSWLKEILLLAAGLLLLVAAGRGEAALPPQAIQVPFGDGHLLEGWLYRPAGNGPHPVAIFNHGSPAHPGDRPRLNPDYPAAADQFVTWGFMVVSVARRGYGRSRGEWVEGFGKCDDPDYLRAGERTAEDIAAVLAHVPTLPGADPGRVVLVGQSAGGWGALTAATQPGLAFKAVINFAGGRGGMRNGVPNNNCAPERLVEAAGVLGARALRPSLWLYTSNDRYFSPELSQRMADVYRARGGPVRFLLLPPVGKDGHALFSLKDGPALWAPHVRQFLEANALLP